MRNTLWKPNELVLLIWCMHFRHCWSMDVHPYFFGFRWCRLLIWWSARIVWILRHKIVYDRLRHLLFLVPTKLICRWFVLPNCVLVMLLLVPFVHVFTALNGVLIFPVHLCSVLHNCFAWFLYVKIGLVFAGMLLCLHVVRYQFAPGVMMWWLWLALMLVRWLRYFTRLANEWVCRVWCSSVLLDHNQFGDLVLQVLRGNRQRILWSLWFSIYRWIPWFLVVFARQIPPWSYSASYAVWFVAGLHQFDCVIG